MDSTNTTTTSSYCSIPSQKEMDEDDLNSDRLCAIQYQFEVLTNNNIVRSSKTKLSWLHVIRETATFKRFSDDIMKHYQDNKQTDEEYARKVEVRDEVKALAQSFSDRGNLDWKFRVIITGSSVTNLASRNSDVDLCFFLPAAQADFDDDRNAALNILQCLRHMMVLADMAGNGISIHKFDLVMASVPVLKFLTKDGIEGDLSVGVDPFVSGAHNSFLLLAFTKVDDRFAPLCMLVKEWASSIGVKRPAPPYSTFNSYALVMLVIHFLQCGVVPPVLPNLQKVYPGFFAESPTVFPKKLDFGNPIPGPLMEAMNHMSVGELFVRFLHYYCEFDFTNYFISIRRSMVQDRRTTEIPARWRDSQVYIEDPMDEHNPGRTVKNLHLVKRAFKKTLSMFESMDCFSIDCPTVDQIINLKLDNPT